MLTHKHEIIAHEGEPPQLVMHAHMEQDPEIIKLELHHFQFYDDGENVKYSIDILINWEESLWILMIFRRKTQLTTLALN